MKICKTCNTYGATLMADKDALSFYATIAPQSDSDAVERFIYAYPLASTEQCYYCARKEAGYIKNVKEYGFSYEGRTA